MKCIVINLERAIKRRELVTREFDSRGLEFELFNARDKLEICGSNYDRYADRSSKLMNWNTSAVSGEIACWMSHQQVWSSCLKDKNINVVAIFEDDAILADNINQALGAIESVSSTFDIVFLENRYPKSVFKALASISAGFTFGLVKYRNTGATGYVINRKAMKHLTEKFPRMITHVDVLLHSSWLHGLRTFTLSPVVVYHRPDPYSFIQSSDSVREGSKFRMAYDRFRFKVRKKWLLRLPERIQYYQRTKSKRSILTD